MKKDRVCKHCGKEFLDIEGRVFSNHVRWCDDNPKSKETYNLREAVNRSVDNKFGKKIEHWVKCYKCDGDFVVVEREFQFPLKDRYFCSRSCANSHKVTKEHRIKVSETITGRPYIESYNKIDICLYCKNEFSYIKTNTSKDRKFCSRSCSIKYYRRNYNEQARLKRDDLVNYRSDCSFKFSLKDYPDEFDLNLIKVYGIYKASNRGNNLNGISRDHMYSVYEGFINNIDPNIISHPANCKLVRHNENSSKHKKCSITLNELMYRISKWEDKYRN